MRGLTTDILAGALSGVVMVPTAMAYGTLTGMGPLAGLYGAVAIGLFAAVMGGTRGIISAPNLFAALLLVPVVAEYGLAAALTTVLLSGLFLVGFGLLRLGRFIVYIPHSLLSGFFTAGGALLIVVQVLPLIGMPSVGGGLIGAVKAWPGATINIDALAVAAITVGAGFLWMGPLAKYVPGQVVALLAPPMKAL